MKKILITSLVFLCIIATFCSCNIELNDTASTDATPENVEKVYLKDYVDGDTFWATDETGESFKVRLIGLDAPESVHADESKNTQWGIYSSEFTKEWLSDRTDDGQNPLYLEYDTEKEDPYGRRLAYVWDDAAYIKNDINIFSDNEDMCEHCLNAVLIYNGMAHAKEYPPNTKYSDIFSSLEDEAIQNNRGNWQYTGYRELLSHK